MDTLKLLVGVLLVAGIIFGSAYFHWWRCGEMFPNAQFACFIGGR